MSKRKQFERLNLALAAALMLAASGTKIMAQDVGLRLDTEDTSQCSTTTEDGSGKCLFPVSSTGF